MIEWTIVGIVALISAVVYIFIRIKDQDTEEQ